jgi:hypothetical protein
MVMCGIHKKASETRADGDLLAITYQAGKWIYIMILQDKSGKLKKKFRFIRHQSVRELNCMQTGDIHAEVRPRRNGVLIVASEVDRHNRSVLS